LTDDTSLRAAEKKGISWKKYDPSIHITNRENTYEISVVSPEEDTSSVITHVGWGDFNNDSIEDVMLIIHHYVIGGRFRSHYFAIITKTGQDKPIKRIYPDGANARSNLSDAYDSLGKHKEAIDAFKQAIRIDPDFALSHNNLGNAYYNSDMDEEAIKSFKQTIRINPDYANAHYNLDVAYSKSGMNKEAIEALP
jgi:tetratricopeptide (TPR) repeat protein